MFASTNACALLGTEAVPVRVEAHIETGLPKFTIVGLREADARETKERIRCGLDAIGRDLPLQRVTVSIAPADLPKAGAAFDLPITLALLGAMGLLPAPRLARLASEGEVGLDGRLREVMGTMAGALSASRARWSEFLVPPASAGRAAHASIDVVPIESLQAAIEHVRGTRTVQAAVADAPTDEKEYEVDLSQVRGQSLAAEALIISAAGGHNLLFAGPPGCGKTMLARRLPTILPPLQGDEALEVAKIHDAAGMAMRGVSSARPFRSPHHTISQQAMLGGGSARPLVGEISLAHRGVLFLDELPEFRPTVLDGLRQPLEDLHVAIRRARWMVHYPTEVQLVAAMNMCRCGHYRSRTGKCKCPQPALRAYQQRISGAIMGRFDLQVDLDIPETSLDELPPAPSSAEARERVVDAWHRQTSRWKRPLRNAHLRGAHPSAFRPTREALDLLQDIVALFGLSGRLQSSILRVSRTIADLAGSPNLEADHLNVAVGLRPHWEATGEDGE